MQREITLYDHEGSPTAYLAPEEENTIYLWSGVPTSYVDKDGNIYGFNGRHLGWFEDGILWDHKSCRVGFTASTLPVFPQFEPFKSFKSFRPFRAFRQFPPFQPFKSGAISEIPLNPFLMDGR